MVEDFETKTFHLPNKIFFKSNPAFISYIGYHILNKYQKHVGDEEDLNIYSFDELVRIYGDFQNMIKNLLLVIEESSHKKEIVYESYNKNFLTNNKYINTHFTKKIIIKKYL